MPRTLQAPSLIKKRSISLNGKRTSLTIEDEFWRAAKIIARERKVTLAVYIDSLNLERPPGLNLSSFLRVTVLQYFMDIAGLGLEFSVEETKK
jgi:predicted DNA-binding ribbon-helix-helix protein